ncbi:CHAD domain-containing protein [Marinibaculum pumilum]|uniref:CHAD domain-containing protein n=1 Tax=Marinibaculum pumilum TaxID=1766165 RepID=A0ABV7KVB3_9PROT
MSYRLDPAAPLGEELLRVCDAQAGQAVAALTERPDGLGEAVHDARKACKRLRAVLRLARPALANAYGRENARYRNAAALLSDLRDADALLESAGDLRDRLGGAVKAPLFNRLRRALEARRDARYAAAGDAEALCSDVAARIDGGRAVLTQLDFPDRPEPLVAGLCKTYTRGRKAYRTCREAQDAAVSEGAEPFHEWRKRVKYHGYHLRLTAAVWPQEAKLQRKAFKELADLLGDDHDIAVFLAADAAEGGFLADPAEAQVLRGALAQRSTMLRRAALELGAVLFAEPPSELAQRLSDLWQPGLLAQRDAA